MMRWYQEIADKELQWLIQYDPDFIDRKKPFDTLEYQMMNHRELLLINYNGNVGNLYTSHRKVNYQHFMHTKFTIYPRKVCSRIL